MKRSVTDNILGFLLYMFFRVDSLLYSLPAWLTLILHFTVGLSIWWFWAVVILWLGTGVLRYSLILFGRWGGGVREPKQKNKNPYSDKGR